MPRSRYLVLTAFVASFAWSVPALAACSVTTAPVAFGGYSPQNATNDDDGVGTISVACDAAAPATLTVRIGIDLGLNGNRFLKLTTGPTLLNYELYKNVARTTVWGDTGGARVAITGRRNQTVLTSVYGRITALQNVVAGSYSDTLVVTITY